MWCGLFLFFFFTFNNLRSCLSCSIEPNTKFWKESSEKCICVVLKLDVSPGGWHTLLSLYCSWGLREPLAGLNCVNSSLRASFWRSVPCLIHKGKMPILWPFQRCAKGGMRSYCSFIFQSTQGALQVCEVPFSCTRKWTFLWVLSMLSVVPLDEQLWSTIDVPYF